MAQINLMEEKCVYKKKVCETLWIICFERNKTSTGLLVSMPGAMQAKAQDPMDITRVKGGATYVSWTKQHS